MKFSFKNPEQTSVNSRTYELEFNVFDCHDGFVDHYINGKLRATVPLENWDGYCDYVPAARTAVLVEVSEVLPVESVGTIPQTNSAQDAIESDTKAP